MIRAAALALLVLATAGWTACDPTDTQIGEPAPVVTYNPIVYAVCHVGPWPFTYVGPADNVPPGVCAVIGAADSSSDSVQVAITRGAK